MSGKKTEKWRQKLNSDESWPRSETLSSHSPLFFAENKDRFLRQLLIRDIQRLTGRPLVVYFSSPFLNAKIRSEDIRRLSEVISPFQGQNIDILIETDGGETDAAEGITSALKEILAGFRAIVALRAKSNGTLVCLAADEILMGATSELGPIEPAVGPIPVSILSHKEYREKTNDIRLSIAADFAQKQTDALAESLLRDGMMSNKQEMLRDTVRKLCTRDDFKSHGSVINHREAKRLGLNVTYLPPDEELWKKISLLHCLYSFDSDARGASKFFEQETYSVVVQGDDPPLSK